MRASGGDGAASHAVALVLQVVRCRVTDEADPFFLYTLDLSEEEFASLKHEQVRSYAHPARSQARRAALDCPHSMPGVAKVAAS